MTIDFAIGLFTGIVLVGVGFAFGLLVGGGGGSRLEAPPAQDGLWRTETTTTYRDAEPPDGRP